MPVLEKSIADRKLEIQALVVLAQKRAGIKPKEKSFAETNWNEFTLNRYDWETTGTFTHYIAPKEKKLQQNIFTYSKFTWNEKQTEAITFALSGKEFCLIGAAGTGKSTTEKGIITALLNA